MIDELMEERMNLAKADRYKESNCIGTALYIVGETPQDEYIESNEKGKTGFVDHVLSKMKKVDEPQIGALLVMRPYNEGRINHMCIITCVDPIMVYHRLAADQPVDENVLLTNVKSYYPHEKIIEFYVKKA